MYLTLISLGVFTILPSILFWKVVNARVYETNKYDFTQEMVATTLFATLGILLLYFAIAFYIRSLIFP
jgi:hypothetical protein